MSTLCLDVGNSNIFGGVFEQGEICFRFRYATKSNGTSDQLGLFLKNVLHENHINEKQLEKIAFCSVVPNINYSLTAACIKYFNIQPFVLQAGVKTGVQIKTANPKTVGTDLIATAVAAINQHENQNIILVDFGTATTFSALSFKKEFLGAVFIPGPGVAMESLNAKTAQLSLVPIKRPNAPIGRTTQECIQAGLYYGHLGAMKEIIGNIRKHTFQNQDVIVVGTGGFANLFIEENIFDTFKPDLVLEGLYDTLLMNS